MSHGQKSMQIGVMDEGQVFISEAIDLLSSSYNNLSKQRLKEHDDQGERLFAKVHSEEKITTTTSNDGFLRRNSSFYSLNDENDNILDDNESIWMQHKPILLKERNQKQRYNGTPRQCKGEHNV